LVLVLASASVVAALKLIVLEGGRSSTLLQLHEHHAKLGVLELKLGSVLGVDKVARRHNLAVAANRSEAILGLRLGLGLNLNPRLAITGDLLLAHVLEYNPVPGVVIHDASLAIRVGDAVLEGTIGRGVEPLVEVNVGAIVSLSIGALLGHKVNATHITEVEGLKDTSNAILRDVSEHTRDVEAQVVVDRRRHLARRLGFK